LEWIAPYLKVMSRYLRRRIGDVTQLFGLVEVPITIRLLKSEAGVQSTVKRLSLNIVDMLSVSESFETYSRSNTDTTWHLAKNKSALKLHLHAMNYLIYLHF
jgi:hypothetical protein